MKLNLGCGSQVVDEWINVDYALGAKLSKIPFFKLVNKKIKLFDLDWDNRIFLHDLTKKFPWEDESVDEIYSSHTLEHFSRTEGLKFLEECHRVLKKGGIIRIVVPDLQCIVNDFNEKKFPANEFVDNLLVLYEKKESRLKSFLAPFIQFPHKCMYDTPTLLSVLTDIGFEAQSKTLHNSDIEDIREIELEGRTKFAVVVEGRKK